MKSKFYSFKIILSLLTSVFFLLYVPASIFAGGLPVEKGALGDIGWYVEERQGKMFYFTHGTTVWGHEFGFYKNLSRYNEDILWLTFSSSDENVKDFIGKDAVVALDIDGEIIKVTLNMLTAGTIGFTHVMYFSNWLAGEQLIDALEKGQSVKVQILEPKEIEVLLDIKEDIFDLNGFENARKKALEICEDYSAFSKQQSE